MRRRTVQVTPRAKADIEGIRNYLRKNSTLENTKRVMGWIKNAILALSETADLHAELEEKGLPGDIRGVLVYTYRDDGTKKSATTKWRLFYRIKDGTVEVMRVRHTSQHPHWED